MSEEAPKKKLSTIFTIAIIYMIVSYLGEKVKQK
jgi:hypothetical protein